VNRKGVHLQRLFPETEMAAANSCRRGRGCSDGQERILVVDDEEPLAIMMQDTLTELGYTVTRTISSREALQLVRLDPSKFDLVMTDFTMPDLTGMDLAREIFTFRSDMPIILCTGFSHMVNENSARAAGMRAFIMKPLTKGEIARTVRKVLDERTAIVSGRRAR